MVSGSRAWPHAGRSLVGAVLVAVLSFSHGAAGPSADDLAAGMPLAEMAAAARWLRTGEALEAQDLADLAVEAFLIAVIISVRHLRVRLLLSFPWVFTCVAGSHQDSTNTHSSNILTTYLHAQARLDPLRPTAHERMGKILETRFGDSEGATPHYHCALRRGSTDAQMHYLMGNFASSRGQHVMAVRLHTAAIALQPSHFEAHNNLGTAFISLANAANQSHTHVVRQRARQ